MKKSPMMKFFVILVLVFFILSTGLMFVLYLASPSTILELENQETITIQEQDLIIENQEMEFILDENTLIQEDESTVE
jgi:cell division protein YceG involved in septum cleavage